LPWPYFSVPDRVMTVAVSRYMLNLPSTTRGSFEKAMYAGRSTPVKMQSKARTVRVIIMKRAGSTGGRVRRIRRASWSLINDHKRSEMKPWQIFTGWKWSLRMAYGIDRCRKYKIFLIASALRT
jgi:hypothetical protein